MKNKKLLTATFLLGTALALGGCGVRSSHIADGSLTQTVSTTESAATDSSAGTKQSAKPIMINYSFLYDDATKDEVRSIMIANGIPEERIDAFLSTVTQFSDTMQDMKGSGDGYATVDATTMFYDPEYIGEKFITNLKFDDQNCRLTAYSLFGDAVTLDANSDFQDSHDSLYGDFEILKSNKNLNFSDEDKKKYTALFASVDTEKTSDITVLASAVKDSFAARGIKFNSNIDAQLASVMIYDSSEHSVFPGHAGVVFTTDNGYLLIEKLAQYTPFMAVQFEKLEDLNSYMLSEVAGFAQDASDTSFVMLNDELL